MNTRAQVAAESKQVLFRPRGIAVMAASWSLAGGLAGGLLVVGFILTGRLHPDGLITALTAALGSIFGAAHGAVLGHLGRAATLERGQQWREWTLAGFTSTIASVVAISAALWLSLIAVAVRAGSPLSWVIVGASGTVCLAVFVWVTALGWHALGSAYSRWPDHSIGSWLVVGVFMLLAGTLLLLRPTLPGTNLQLSTPMTIVVAALATLWVALPAIVLALRRSHSP